MCAVPPHPHLSAGGRLSLLHSQLKQLAATRMAAEAGDQTLQPTALMHEMYLRMAKANNSQTRDGAAYFFATAAEAMWRTLVESARQRCSLKRGGDGQRPEWNDARHPGLLKRDELPYINESLVRLADEDPQKAEFVKRRYLAGMSHQETAKIFNI